MILWKHINITQIPHGALDDEAVRIFVEFTRLESAIKGMYELYCHKQSLPLYHSNKFFAAVIDLNGRYFGGRVVRASFFPEDRFSQLDLAP